MLRLIIYTGKGGTGKTVTSCSTAIKLAEHDHKTLVISSDPAHTLGDAFMMPHIGYELQEILPNLEVLQIDPVTEMSKQYDALLSYMTSIFSGKGIDETLAYEIAMLPGMTQLFSLLKIEELVKLKSFDSIVVDMPASGEALRYLYFPKLVGSIGRKLTGLAGMFSGVARMFQPISKIPVPSKGVLQSEVDLLDRLEYLSEIIRNREMTSIRLVANPDTFSIENAKRALMTASLFGINVDLAIINKIMPHQTSDQYYANWAEYQKTKVEEARANFYPLPIKEVFLHSTELRGIEMLRKNGDLIFGSEDPAITYYRGKAFDFTTEQNSLRMTVKVPFTEKDDFDLERYGDQLTIKVKNPVGYIVNIVPLPSAALGMKLAKAKLSGDELNIFFEKSV
ncbi:MAG: TRC40/GET3/ArsA family transport-energizing ATPase [Nitrososphaeraceae archaeon]|nr:TRC40/GET3/ArsA family transport-energizing ATPase [Nitrososphaeraceae archaeon]MDW0332244.1 TRC40/GET3/ArsA family transport-energizing ATPase [Nitrososphaeraceae archaeon]